MARRIGAPDSRTRLQLLDAAEQLLVEEGYVAVTSRRVGNKAGISPQLVHYYFRTMDDLFLEVLRRRSEEGLQQFTEAVAAGDRSLRTLWEFRTRPHGAAWNLEFASLANHRPVIRAEMARYSERYRRLQLDAIEEILAARGISTESCPPVVVMLGLMGLTQMMAMEEALGTTDGHAEAVAFVEQWIDRLEQTTEVAGSGP